MFAQPMSGLNHAAGMLSIFSAKCGQHTPPVRADLFTPRLELERRTLRGGLHCWSTWASHTRRFPENALAAHPFPSAFYGSHHSVRLLQTPQVHSSSLYRISSF